MIDTCKRCGRHLTRDIVGTNGNTCPGPGWEWSCNTINAAYLRGLSDGLAYSLDVTLNRGCRPMYAIANDGRTDASDVLRSTLRDLQNGTERPDLVGYVNKKGASR